MLHECSNCKRSLVLVPVRMLALAIWTLAGRRRPRPVLLAAAVSAFTASPQKRASFTGKRV